MAKKIQKDHSFTEKVAALLSQMKSSISLFRLNDPLRMAAATAFFTTFALPPILIIFTQFFRFWVDPGVLSSELISRLGHILGRGSARQVEGVLEAVSGLNQSWYVTVFGFIFLMFVATTLFDVIKNSLEQIWDIRKRPKSGILFNIRYRMRSLIIIFLAGFLFLAALFLEGSQVILGNYLGGILGGGKRFFYYLINDLIFVIVVSIWFTVLFRFLTIGRPRWNIAFGGALFTAILFNLGKWILGYLLVQSNIGIIYGASGSMVLILLFVFYSSIILYYGACFVKILSDAQGKPIRTVKEAFSVELLEVKDK
ncbi:MAG TPA: YihY/virulence factor BrkB family protein [Daejeonella sp.]|uniref:YihY/virulence factor BrkB family protein n=1 Tax=Daejeonella sp. TaxID=2805397 RepID=UPI002EDA7C5C